MEPKKNNLPFYAAFGGMIWLMLLWVTCHYHVCALELGTNVIFDVLPVMMTHMQEAPFAILPLDIKTIAIVTGLYIVVLLYAWVEHEFNRQDAAGKEGGSAKWFTEWKLFRKKYVDKSDKRNMIFSNEVKLDMNTRKTRKNNNVLVIGGSGTGKSRFMIKPNLLQANCSYVVTDPSGELLQTQAHHLEKEQGYKIKVFDLTDMTKSSHYNPFNYIRNENGVLQMINCLIKNTNGDKKGAGDPFWEKAETTLLLSLCFYLRETVPLAEQNFSNVMRLLKVAGVDEDDPNAQSQLDIMMETLREKNPESMAVSNYDDFKQAAGKTLKSILISASVRLQAFNFADVKLLTDDDTLDLGSIGDEKQALFVVIPAADSTFNFLVSMMYSQLFETLYYHAEHDTKVCKGKRLPVHVRFLLDEFANIGTIPEFEKKLSTMRKYEISCTIVLQSLSQLKSMYKDDWEVIVDNCDSFLFLGCQGKTTLEYVNQKLGKTTIRSKDHSRTHGTRGSVSTSGKHEARDLMTVAEIQQMPDKNCILFIRGMNPFYCTKFTLEKHKNYQHSGDADEKNEYYYDPNKNSVQSVGGPSSDEVKIEKAVQCPDVNAERIMKEQRVAEEVQEENRTSKNGRVLDEFKPLSEVVEDLQEEGKPINVTIVAGCDRDYEFRTTRPYIFDLNSVDLEDEDNGEYVGEEPGDDNMPEGFEMPMDSSDE